MLRYADPYGGITTVIGEFTPEDVESYVWKCWKKVVRLRGVSHNDGKVMDLFFDKKEVLGYATRSGKIRLEVINK